MMFMKLVPLLAAIAPASLTAVDFGGVQSAGNHVSEVFDSGLEVGRGRGRDSQADGYGGSQADGKGGT